jgi:SAM-dependent methyltransferase
MGWWEKHVVPRITDKSCGMAEVRPHRAAVVAGLHGRVLEIGFGSGHNVPLYPAAVTEVHAVEPSDLAWRLARDRLATSRVPVVRSGLDGQRLAEEDDAFDCVLSTFTLCTIPDQRAALAEVRRVLRAGGTFHFLEHGASPDARVARWQHRLEPVQRRVAGGCHLTRDPVADVTTAGLALAEVENAYLPGPGVSKAFGYLYRGRATA